MLRQANPAVPIAFAILAILSAAESKAAMIAFELQIANPVSSTSSFRLLNTSPDASAEIVRVAGTIGDTNYNFDIVSGFSPLIDSGTLLVPNLEVGDPSQGGVRTDDFAISFDGFDQNDRFQFQVDLDHDSGDSVEDLRYIYFNNGSAPNSVITVDFRVGSELGSLVLELPDDPLVNDPQVFNFSLAGETTSVPEPTGAFASLACAAYGLLVRRRTQHRSSDLGHHGG